MYVCRMCVFCLLHSRKRTKTNLLGLKQRRCRELEVEVELRPQVLVGFAPFALDCISLTSIDMYVCARS